VHQVRDDPPHPRRLDHRSMVDRHDVGTLLSKVKGPEPVAASDIEHGTSFDDPRCHPPVSKAPLGGPQLGAGRHELCGWVVVVSTDVGTFHHENAISTGIVTDGLW